MLDWFGADVERTDFLSALEQQSYFKRVMLIDGDNSAASPASSAQKARSSRKRLIAVLFSVALVLLLYFVFPSVFSKRFPGVRVHSTSAMSMAPTVGPGDRVLVNFAIYDILTPKRGDTVVAEMNVDVKPLLVFKRVVAIGGDEITLTPTKTILNGKELAEPYVNRQAENGKPVSEYQSEFGPFRVPSGQFFLLGDNRMESYDSRYIGSFTRAQIKGKAMAVIRSGDPTGAWRSIR
jgi:signal peptidase I